GFILVNTALGRLKQKNLARDPRVAVSVADGSNPYDMVTVRGEVVEQVTGEAAEGHIDRLAKKYINQDKYPGRAPGEKRVLLKIRPTKVFHMKPWLCHINGNGSVMEIGWSQILFIWDIKIKKSLKVII
ncbi:MAG: pyridoxamine 5'-phosphate oxidase family protein, partial [Thermoproteota archaeon]|nr:pyridoxamine 5'-phosphate oxidase family protein [Thermoproteota archaeon]